MILTRVLIATLALSGLAAAQGVRIGVVVSEAGAEAVRAEGATIMPTAEFLQRLEKTRSGAKKSPGKGSAGPVNKVTRAQEDSITKELKDVWIKRNKKDG